MWKLQGSCRPGVTDIEGEVRGPRQAEEARRVARGSLGRKALGHHPKDEEKPGLKPESTANIEKL